MNSLRAIYYETKEAPCLELFPKKTVYTPDRFDDLYKECLDYPYGIFIITSVYLFEDIPQSIPVIVLGSETTHSRFQYNTFFIDATNTNKKAIRDLLDTIPKNRVCFPITPRRPNYFWQYPVITEKYAFERISLNSLINSIYIGIPYATIIDKKLVPHEELKSIQIHIQHLKKSYPDVKIISACQHIHYKILVQIYEFVQIDTLYISHKNITKSKLGKLRLEGLPLYPVNIFDKTRQAGLFEPPQRQYLFSFIGAYMKHYLHPIRQKILSWPSTNTTIIEDTKLWHFEKNVYTEQVLNKSLPSTYYETQLKQTEHYNEILSNSEFSLCPVGAGPNTIRLWESICTGSIPIIIADEFDIQSTLHPTLQNLRFYIQLPYTSIHLKSSNHLTKYLESISKDDIEQMRKNCIQIHNFLQDQFIPID
jgi:hypothetical protein